MNKDLGPGAPGEASIARGREEFQGGLVLAGILLLVVGAIWALASFAEFVIGKSALGAVYFSGALGCLNVGMGTLKRQPWAYDWGRYFGMWSFLEGLTRLNGPDANFFVYLIPLGIVTIVLLYRNRHLLPRPERPPLLPLWSAVASSANHDHPERPAAEDSGDPLLPFETNNVFLMVGTFMYGLFGFFSSISSIESTALALRVFRSSTYGPTYWSLAIYVVTAVVDIGFMVISARNFLWLRWLNARGRPAAG